ncbi:hypothetical protein KY290_010060 [Solanum tuberosum]|uniref:UBL3-like ubiquitin domain-containing protein n=1 Tax=Solanum tuberosum TaxID=4113 RepID=A0ABQ7VWS3_SOLTU|nr:hypothetical protein KY289_010440 [Solanum tuberosum]KAH0772923.1 hypothetical protein KY290_010060 [Solanum tuberosum]
MAVQELVEIKFRLADGSDIGPNKYASSTTVASLKDKLIAQWPKGCGIYSLVQFPAKTKTLGDFFRLFYSWWIELPDTCCLLLVGGGRYPVFYSTLVKLGELKVLWTNNAPHRFCSILIMPKETYHMDGDLCPGMHVKNRFRTNVKMTDLFEKKDEWTRIETEILAPPQYEGWVPKPIVPTKFV